MEISNGMKRNFLLMSGKAMKEDREAMEEYEQLRMGGILPKSPTPNENGSGSRVDYSAYFARLETMITKDLMPKKMRRMKIRQSVLNSIEKLDDERERLIMRTRYLHLIQTEYEKKHDLEGTEVMTWKQVADYCGYSKQGARKIHTTALKKIEVPQWCVKELRRKKSST